MTYRIILFAYSEWCQDKEQQSFQFVAEKNENMRKEKAREEREKEGKGKRKMVTKGTRSDCIVALSLSLSISLDFLELIVSYLFAVSSFYPSILTFLLPCSAFTFFFAPEGTRSIFLGSVEEVRRRSGLRGCSSTMQSMHRETKRQ